ncbi:hypothetical protein A2U01_0109224, partial [Trifolium medium]|nr:hypothetical protein [Trifolium medium]
MYQLHLQGPVMNPEEFHAHNYWPGDMPHFGEGAGADGDDDTVDEAAADAAEDDDDQNGDDD